MSHLADYVAQIHGLTLSGSASKEFEQISELTKLEYESDIEMTRTIKLYQFSDGTQVQQIVEQDAQPMQVEACLESWIEYKVLNHSNVNIHPQKVNFDNHCREMHWIRYFSQAHN